MDILFSECVETDPVPTQYTVMPLYLGNLWNLLLKMLDVQTKERIILQVFEGLRHMHKNQVLHRDLKPDNIFWATESPATVKIGDYGLATSLTDRPTLFDTCGTTAYMAPEVFQKNVLQTTAVDMFSLGATVFAILDHETVAEGWYIRDFGQYNRVFENVADYPPKLYAGLVQSMMAPNPEDRPSLDICIEVVKGQHYDWIKMAPVARVLAAAPVPAIQHDNQSRANAPKQQETTLDRVRAWAAKRKLDPIVYGRQPDHCQVPQQNPVKNDYRYPTLLKKPQAPIPQAVAVQAPKLIEPAPVQGVNFQDGLPSYEEATSKNPFAKLVDSNEIAKNRRRSKLAVSKNKVGPVAEQSAKPSLRQPHTSNKKHTSTHAVPPTNPIRAAIQPPNRRRQTLHRTGTGRIRKTTLTGIKAGALDMAKGLYQFSRGFGLATRHLGSLTAEGLLMCYDLATRKESAPAALRLTLSDVETRLVMSYRVRALRRERESCAMAPARMM